MQRTGRYCVALGVIIGLVVAYLGIREMVSDNDTHQINKRENIQASSAKEFGKLPLYFEPNVGQAGEQIDFISRGQGYALYLTGEEAVLALNPSGQEKSDERLSDVIRIELLGANTASPARGVEPLSGKSNYILGNDSSQWYTDISHYAKVEYEEVYPGIDLVYYGTEQRLLEHDFVVSPGVNPDVIKFTMSGVENLALNETGDLIASTQGGDVVLQAPVTYQDIGGERIPVSSKYVLADDVVSFELAAYDNAHEVVIDPVLSYATYFGGSNDEFAYDMAIDNSGNIYLTGRTQSPNLPTQSAFQGSHGGNADDVFVVAFNSSGSGLIYSTYLGGNGNDRGWGIAVDGAGQAYITGETRSTDFPTQSAIQSAYGTAGDGFVSVLNSTGSSLIYSTYLGGSSGDIGEAIAVDGSGNAYVTGFTGSTNFPLQSPFQGTHASVGTGDAFVSVINSTGSGFVYSTYLGGGNGDEGHDIVADASGNAYVTGRTRSTNFPMQSAFQPVHGGGIYDVFVSVFNPTGSGLIYSTYLGGNNDDFGEGIVVDSSGNAFITGITHSDFPVQSAFQSGFGGGTLDAFVSAFNATGSALIYSTYLGGSGDDYGYDIALDNLGQVYVTGQTSSSNFPLVSAFQSTLGGGVDAFVAVFNSSGSGLINSTYLGGVNTDVGHGIVLDSSDNVFVAGYTNSGDFPITSAYQAVKAGGNDVFLAKIASHFDLSIPDVTAKYNTTIDVPIQVETNVTGLGIVASEISVTYRNDIVASAVTSLTKTVGAVTTNSMVYQGWSIEENIFTGTSVDTLKIAMSTAQDTLTGQGDLIYLTLQVADVRQPDSTALAFYDVLFNDGTPVATTTDGSLKVTGTDAAISAEPDSILPGDVVTIRLVDPDFDLDGGIADQVSVTAFSVTYGDSQSVILTEIGPNAGEFTGTVATVFSAIAGTPQDGVIGTIAGDSIGAVVVDVLTSAGTTAPLYASPVPVYGGEDGVVLSSFVVQALDGRDGVRDTVRVEVVDGDLNANAGIAEVVSATILNAISGESEDVILTETDVNTGVFQVRVPTISGSSGVNNDGELSLASEDTLYVTYVDSLTSQGGVLPIVDVTQVVNLFGDVRSNDQVQAFDAASVLAHAVGLNTYTSRDSLLGDVDGNGDVKSFDASLVLQYVVRLIDRFPVQTDASFNPPADEKNHPFLKPVLMDHIALGEMRTQEDGTYLLPVTLMEREGVVSGTLTLGVGGNVDVLDVTPADGYEGFMTAFNQTDSRVKIGFAGSQSSVMGAGDVLLLQLRSTGADVVRVRLDEVAINGQSLTPRANIEALTEAMTKDHLSITQVHQNVPNPFNPQTTIRYDLAEAGDVQVVIYSVTGQHVRTLVSNHQEAGSYEAVWNGEDALGHQVSSGIYMMRFVSRNTVQIRKMLLLR